MRRIPKRTMNNIYTPEDLRTRLRPSKVIAKETIRQWSIEFAEYLSPSASPSEKGKHRLYNDDDWTVFSLVAEMKDRGVTFEEIHLALKNGQRGELPDGVPGMALSMPNQQIALIQAKILDLEDKVEELTEERDRFRMEAATERALRERADQTAAELQAEIRKLYREIGVLSRDEKKTD